MAKKKVQKRYKLTRLEEFYIRQNPDAQSAEDISKMIRKPIELIQAVIDDEKQKIAEASEKAKKRGDTLFRQTMGRKERKGKPVAAVMTPAASELADKTKKRGAGSEAHIFRPYG